MSKAVWDEVASHHTKAINVYSTLPSESALKYLVDRQVGKAVTTTEEKLTDARIKEIESEIECKVGLARAELYRAQTQFTREQTAVFSKTIIDEEQVVKILISLQKEFVLYWQKFTLDEFRSMDESKRQMILEHFVTKMRDVSEELFNADDLTIEAKFEDER